MDYGRSPLRFRIRKVLRYARMYGVSRTLTKVRGHYHMRARYDELPSRRTTSADTRHVGVIGCGNYAFGTIGYFLNREVGSVVRGVMDIDVNRAVSMFERYRADYYTTDAEELLSDSTIDLVYIASNHASHADYAIRAIQSGKAVHIEKPHVVDSKQLSRLMEAAAAAPDPPRIALGFNRPFSPLSGRVQAAMARHDGPSIISWFVAGHRLDPGHWYLKPAEGGRVLGNLCHWTDFCFHMVPPDDRYPIRVVPVSAGRTDCDISVSLVFGDGSIATIAFSEKGEPFEGVHEQLNVHKGDLLVSLANFGRLEIEELERKRCFRPLFRQHGHKHAILASYEMSDRGGGKPGVDLRYVRETAELFLATRAALENSREITLQSTSLG